jgi:osmoprotectant transport system substrate-binding protein
MIPTIAAIYSTGSAVRSSNRDSCRRLDLHRVANHRESVLPAIAPALIAAVLAVVLVQTAAPTARAAGAIVVASKIDTEGTLLGNMITLRLEAGGLPVERKIQLGPTNIVRAAILAGQIDLYPEYTGNGASFFHREGDPTWKNGERGYAEVSRLDLAANHLVWLTPAAANNTWVIAIRRDLAGFAARNCLDDLATYLAEGRHFKLAASAEFVESPAALPAFEHTYGFRLAADQLLTLSGGNTAATLRAAAEGISGVNAAMAYGTDGEISALGLTALCDDKGAQIVYLPTPVVRQVVLDQHPEIAAALGPVFASLTLTALQELNARIAVGGEDAGAVAADYLKSKHFLP